LAFAVALEASPLRPIHAETSTLPLRTKTWTSTWLEVPCMRICWLTPSRSNVALIEKPPSADRRLSAPTSPRNACAKGFKPDSFDSKVLRKFSRFVESERSVVAAFVVKSFAFWAAVRPPPSPIQALTSVVPDWSRTVRRSSRRPVDPLIRICSLKPFLSKVAWTAKPPVRKRARSGAFSELPGGSALSRASYFLMKASRSAVVRRSAPRASAATLLAFARAVEPGASPLATQVVRIVPCWSPVTI